MSKRVINTVLIRTLIVTGTMVLIAACESTGAGGGDSSGSTTYDIGDTGPSGVGIVFYVTDGGLHGLEVAPNDQDTGTAWSNVTDSFANGNSALPTETGTGSANTDAIIAQPGHTSSAAKISRDYRAAEEGDWFLPSRDELNAIWDNLVDDGTGSNNGVGGFSEADSYWSSSEISFDNEKALFFSFSTGSPSYNVKSLDSRVRAVRSF